MQSNAWATLLRQLPEDKFQSLSLVTTGGTEIALQAILRIEGEFIAIKGRLAGSQDAGRIYFIPYCHIDYLGTQVEVKDTEFQAMFGHLDLSGAPPAPAAPPVPVAPSAVLTKVSEHTPVPGAGPPVVPIRSAVLERFRSRNHSAPGTIQRPPVSSVGNSHTPG